MKSHQANDQNIAFHKAFSDWLSSCSSDDADKLEKLQGLYPPTEVQSMKSFLKDCLVDPARRDMLPTSLVEQLQKENWLPAQLGVAAA
jgi:hypothetical protein